MDISNATHCLKRDYTYKDLTKPINREYMSMLPVCSLGTKSGGFGPFKEQFKVVSKLGVENILDELQFDAGLSLEKLFKICPTLKSLLNNASHDNHPDNCKGGPDCQGINCAITNDAFQVEFATQGDAKNQMRMTCS